MQIIFDFVAGNISFDDFWPEFCRNSELQTWFDTAGNFEPEELPWFKKGSLHWLFYDQIRRRHDRHALQSLPMFLVNIPEKNPLLSGRKIQYLSKV